MAFLVGYLIVLACLILYQADLGQVALALIAVTLVDLRDPQQVVQASYRGDTPIYPASVVKLFYLVAVHRWLEDGRLQDTDELRRATRDMIVESYNEATHYVVDLLTGTTSGPELSPGELQSWADKRNAVNRYFASVGYTNINVNQKPWGDGPYGRERVWVGKDFGNRNALATDYPAEKLEIVVASDGSSDATAAIGCARRVERIIV